LTGLISVSAASLLMSVAARAQQSPAQQGAAAGPEEIVVTAEKRDVPLQRAPVAITALSAESLDQANITNPAQLNGLVPSLSITQSESFQRIVRIRGVGFDTPQNGIAQPAVAFHIDGVYIGNTTALTQDFFDIDQIEVLRGPQGTVYGQNSEGGTIDVVTKKPELQTVSGTVDMAYGSYNFIEPRAALNVPIGDTLAIRTSVVQLQHDGFAKSTELNGYGLDDADQTGVRTEVLWSPNANFSALFSSQYYTADQHDAELKNILDPNPNPREVSQDYPGTFKTDQYIESLTLTQNLSWATVKSISSWQYLTYVMNLDNDRLDFAHYDPHDIMPYSGDKDRTWTQEVNLASPGEQTIDWIAGAFLLDSKNKGNVLEYYTTKPNEPVPVVFSANPNGSLPSDLGYQSSATPVRLSWSTYGQATYHLNDSLRLTGGLRFTHDRAESVNSSYFGAYGPPTTVKETDNELTGKVGIDYDLTPVNLLYASWSRGFKPGGSNLSTDPVLVGLTFKPETVDAYEIGVKNRLFDNALTLNVAGFYYDYKNYQFNEDDPIPYQGGVANIPSVQIYGAEAEFKAKLPYGFGVDGNASVLAGEVTSNYKALDTVAANEATAYAASLGYGAYDPHTIALVTASEQNLNGSTPSHLPPFSGTIGLTHSFEFANGSSLLSRIDYNYQGHFESRIFNNEQYDRVGSYGLWNLAFDYYPPNAHWKFQLIGTNLLGRDAVATTFTNAFGFGTTAKEYVAPQQVIGRIAYSF